MDTKKTESFGIPRWLVCIDVETTGLDPRRHGLLSVGAYHPASGEEFYGECRPPNGAVVDAAAMRVNGQNITEARARCVDAVGVVTDLGVWLDRLLAREAEWVGKLTVVGKNPRFDLDWILENDWSHAVKFKFSHRTIDVHAVALALAAARGLEAPRMEIEAIYEALGLPVEPKPHNAFTGALFAWLALREAWRAMGFEPGVDGQTQKEAAATQP